MGTSYGGRMLMISLPKLALRPRPTPNVDDVKLGIARDDALWPDGEKIPAAQVRRVLD